MEEIKEISKGKKEHNNCRPLKLSLEHAFIILSNSELLRRPFLFRASFEGKGRVLQRLKKSIKILLMAEISLLQKEWDEYSYSKITVRFQFNQLNKIKILDWPTATWTRVGRFLGFQTIVSRVSSDRLKKKRFSYGLSLTLIQIGSRLRSSF